MVGFASIASPLNTLTQKSVKFERSEACERSFQVLKDRLTSTPVLNLLRVPKVLWYIMMLPGGIRLCAYEPWKGSSICL